MSRDVALAAGRAFADVGFVDACIIQRVTASSTNLLDGTLDEELTTVYEGRCKLKHASPRAGQSEAAQAAVRLSAAEVHLPVESAVRVEDRVTITVCRLDPSAVGRRYTVVGEPAASYLTARRVPLQEVLS